MKKILLILLLPIFCWAQAPQGISYQGVATDANGAELINQNISLRMSVLSGSALGAVEWEETHNTTTDDFGLFTLQVGLGTSTGGGLQTAFDSISWGTNTHFLKVELDASGGTAYTHIGTNQMMSVPYALYGKDEDADDSNELQTLSLSGDTLFISGGNYILLNNLSSGGSTNNTLIYTTDGF